ncbi:response regulator [Pedobacter cryophilus]|uniref:histidine kinase n=1 Tax=Pedobacter cryophilus TaxID=2571271 RepID=A0A4U1C049_9SPHI|nr:response regulator [Pedobacter cryophilus]TKB98561.1 response regulator [Pedobacter cryophilus]
MNSNFLKNLQLSLSLSFILLIASSAAALLSIKGLVENQDLVGHTEKVLRSLENVMSSLKDAENGQRGYVITSDQRFLAPYLKSKTELPDLLASLKEITSDNPIQEKNWIELNTIINSRTGILDRNLDRKLKNQSVSLQDMLNGQLEMDKCKFLIDNMTQIEETLFKSRSQEAKQSATYTSILIFVFTIISLLSALIFYRKIRSDFKMREELKNELLTKDYETSESILAIEDIAIKIAKGNYSDRIKRDDLGILSKISVSLNLMAESLETSFNKINDDEWMQKGLAIINDKLVGNKNIKEIAGESLNYLIEYGQCNNGAIYIYNEGKLELKASYGKEEYMKNSFDEGEGIIGQVFTSKKLKLIENLTEENYGLSFSGGKIKLDSLLIIPITYEKNTVGVIELGSTSKFNEIDLSFHDCASTTIGAAIISASFRKHNQNLLEQTQAQTEELQSQHTELEALNFELEVQTQKLQASEEELKVQQEELMESNQELEERSKLLEEKNQLIIDRNIVIQEKAEELALSTKYKSEFLANMSHELRTPLNSILLLSRLTAENLEGNLNEDQIESAKVIQSSGNGLLALIDEILDLSKIEAGKMDMHYEVAALKTVVDELSGMFNPIVNQKNISLVFTIDEHADTIGTDITRLGQILKNLLSNAIKFTSEGKVSLHISEKDNQISFNVTDTGIGISKDKQKLIFEAFQQEDGSTRRKFGGTGLGLSISRELVKLLGGFITLESEPGKGSTFIVTLPKFTTQQATILVEDNNKIEEQKEAISPPDYSNIVTTIPADVADDRLNISPNDKVILIVEDDIFFAKTLITYANKENYKAIVVVRGDLALPAALEYKPSAILLDIQLPVMDGWMVMDALKANTKTRHIPVHIMSSLQAKKESLLKGAVDFIDKPFAFEQLGSIFTKIENALNKDPKKVLIVEENPQHATALSYYLSNFNISTEIKNSVADSAKALQEQDVDCVILDMGISDSKTFETLEIIRKNKGLENLPIIVFTGKNISKIEEQKIKKYADTIVVKTANTYQRILDEVGLFLHLVSEDSTEKSEKTLRKLGVLSEVIKNKTVLIADDDVRNIFAISKVLEKYQMNMISAIDGKEALIKLENNPNIDVVLMDIMMPQMDGYETIQAIRKNAKYAKLPIIAVTSKAMMGDREKCIKAGASDYISKPVDLDQLLSLLRVWLYQN